ncbi:MAG TPA: hydantoinase B/oxoprolinase family protein [Gemmatimonadaceae bacterium]
MTKRPVPQKPKAESPKPKAESPKPRAESRKLSFDPLEITVMSNAFAMIAEEMGTVMIRGALSPNIRERRDLSAALFDGDGQMVAQAAHIPVHLGAMPESVAAVRRCEPKPGDVFILNDPYEGGSHLPDLTTVEAIGNRGKVVGFAAVRAHHADVGGMSPGSMPQGATELVQEGIVLPPVRLVKEGALDDELLRLILANVRTPDERRGDLRAQLAACAAGAAGWLALIEREGATRIASAVDAVLAYTERLARARIAQLGDVKGSARDALEGDGVTDSDVPVVVSISVVGSSGAESRKPKAESPKLRIDFTGSSPIVAGNVNCPASVTRAAAVFVLRSLMEHDVPTNDGIARALDLVIPANSVLNAKWPAAVAAGNVEMSQRITDTIFAALANAGVSVPAQGQGTMNNITFGGRGWTFYETLGGGQGASDRAAGPSAVHVGMSNTLNTPVESLESSYPLRIDEYALRRGSGGAGRRRGGDGVVRVYRTMETATVTLVTERRRLAPRGAAGGSDGAPGRNSLDGRELPAKCRVTLSPGARVRVETPGGGGFGGASG